jgi:hypothetical protein
MHHLHASTVTAHATARCGASRRPASRDPVALTDERVLVSGSVVHSTPAGGGVFESVTERGRARAHAGR